MQATFFIALAVASRLGTAALAAHQIVAQLWLLTSYVTDGFATVLGSRLSPQRHATADSNGAKYTTHVTYISSCVWSKQCMIETQENANCKLVAYQAALPIIFCLCSKQVCLSMSMLLQKPSDPVQMRTAEWSRHWDGIRHSIFDSSGLAHLFVYPKRRHHTNPATHPLAAVLHCSASELSCFCV